MNISSELGLPLIIAKSNIHKNNKNKVDHFLCHDFTSAFGIYCLQKLWAFHLYSSEGEPLSICNIDCTFKRREGQLHNGHFFLNYLSTRGLRIYNAGIEATRMDKLEFIADFPIVQKYLSVCLYSPTSCNVCAKCRRTLLELDAIEKLEKFGEVFDIQYYKDNRPEYYQYMFDRIVVKDHYCLEVLQRIQGRISKEEYDFYFGLALQKIKSKPELNPLEIKKVIIGYILKVLVDAKRYKKFRRNQKLFFRDSKSIVIRFLGRLYN